MPQWKSAGSPDLRLNLGLPAVVPTEPPAVWRPNHPVYTSPLLLGASTSGDAASRLLPPPQVSIAGQVMIYDRISSPGVSPVRTELAGSLEMDE